MHENFTMVVIALVSLCCLLILFSLVRHYTKKSLMPADAWILIIGIIYGITIKEFNLESLPKFELHPEFIILLLLPLLIFASGRLIDLQSLKSESVPIGFFAIIGVIATSFMIGAPIAWILNIPLLNGLLIGAAAGATDPAAVAAIFHRFNIPERLSLMVEGESLFNDGTTVVLFTLISSLLFGNEMFHAYESLGLFAWAIFGALPLGGVIGWLGAKLLIIWKEKNVFFQVSMTFVVTYTAFLLAEEVLHVSGVISILLAAIIFFKTWNKSSVEADDQEQVMKDEYVVSQFWDYIALLINGVLFFSLGAATGQHDFLEVPTIAVIVGLVSLIVSRCILIYGGNGVLALVKKNVSFPWQNILIFGGLRGAVTVALILMIPHDYEYRGIFLCIAFAMIAFTLIIQPILMKLYLKKAEL